MHRGRRQQQPAGLAHSPDGHSSQSRARQKPGALPGVPTWMPGLGCVHPPGFTAARRLGGLPAPCITTGGWAAPDGASCPRPLTQSPVGPSRFCSRSVRLRHQRSPVTSLRQKPGARALHLQALAPEDADPTSADLGWPRRPGQVGEPSLRAAAWTAARAGGWEALGQTSLEQAEHSRSKPLGPAAPRSLDEHPCQAGMRSKTRMLLLTALVVSLTMLRHHLRDRHLELRLSDWFDPRKRPDVVTTTPWLAPVVWEGTFDRQVLEKFYRRQNLTVGLAVFAAGRFAEESLLQFLRLADTHFLAGHRVVFYVLSDRDLVLQDLRLGPLRALRTLDVDGQHEWPEAQLWRMRSLGAHILQRIQHEVQFLFSATAEQLIQSAVGTEVLGASVARLHAWWYFHGTRNLPYERRPASAACIPLGQGDFYYDGALVGGTPLRLLDFIEEYLRGAAHDFQAGLNSTYERHLNKYFFVHKPSKLLSPEYGWDTSFNPPPQIRYVKVAQQPRRRW